MKEQDLQYIIKILKGEEPHEQPSDWYSLLGFLQCHRIAGLFYSRALKMGLPLSKRAEKQLSEIFERQKRRVKFMRKYISELSDVLQKRKAECVFLKGSVLTNLSDFAIYSDGERSFNDIDLLVEPGKIEDIESVLRHLGYVQGKYDAEEKTIKPYTRLEIVKRRMNRGEVAPFVRLTGCEEIPFVEVDINFSLGNTPHEEQKLLAEMVGTGMIYEGKVCLRVPNDEMFFLHLILHQYKESCSYFMVERGKELELYKLADIYFLFNPDALDKRRCEKVVSYYHLEDKYGAVLEQVGEIFNDEEIKNYADRFYRHQPEIINYEKKRKYSWMASIRERLCAFDSVKYLQDGKELW